MGLKYFRCSEFENAVREFERVLALKPGDIPSEIYIKRSQYLMNGLKPDWEETV